MMIKNCNGVLPGCCLACASLWVGCVTSAHAWQQEYIATDPQNNTSARYTWDSDHQPRYDDILAERIDEAQAPIGLAVNQESDRQADAAHAFSVGWNFSLTNRITTGPVASWRDENALSWNVNEFGDLSGAMPANDQLWHSRVSSLGWRVDSQALWGVRPWARVSYNQQLSDNPWQATLGFQEGNWVDVSVGADMPLNANLAAYAALSQAENTPTGESYLYVMGISARF